MARPTEERDRHVSSGGLSAADFTRIAANGFGDPQNSYAYSMAYFRDHVYVGTLRNALPLLKLFPPRDAPSLDPWPVKTVDRVEELDMQAQIWRWSPSSAQWEKVLTAPMITGSSGQEAPRDLGYRGMVVFQGLSDAAPALYVSAVSTVLRGTAARILRSEDGMSFTAVSEPGLGNPKVSTFRSLVAFDNYLFAAPAGEGTTWNTTRDPAILRCADPVAGRWETACPPGFGDPANTGIFELTVFNDHLYAGTFNYYDGFQIWKTPATGAGPCRWTKVLEQGAYRGNFNETTMGMCPFNGALYVGSGIQNGGYDRTNLIGPAAGEMIRIYPDDSWELLVGTPRQTPDGIKYPLSGMGPGFDNIFAGYIWRMAVHEGWLYASTFDWSMFLPYARRPPPGVKRLMHRFGMEQMLRCGSGFQLWRSQDGRNWVPVTRTGMGNPYNHGGRTLLSTPHGLFLGTANPFGPEVAAKLSTGWIYVPNPSGGAEVWLGRLSGQLAGRGSWDWEDGQDRTEPIPVRDGPSADGPLSERSALPYLAHTRGKRRARVLLTGATGFIGSHVLRRLLEHEGRIRVYALPETVHDLQQSDRVEVVTGDLQEEAGLAEALQDIETVYHLAGVLPGSSYDDLMRVNVHSTENLLRACGRAGGVLRFVFTSSVAVYGTASSPEEWPFSEVSPLQPRGIQRLRLYGLSKVAAEGLVQRYAQEFGFEYVILRPPTVYGLGSQRTESLVEWVLTEPRAGYHTLVDPYTQLLHVRDLAEVVALAGTHSEAANEIFNVAGMEVVTYRNLVTMIRRLGGVTDRRTLIPDRSEVWRRFVVVYDVTKAQQRLGFTPRVTLREGLAEMVAAFMYGDLALKRPGRIRP
jgi:nucleoside-diphosphate-sugar epimerase